MNDCFCTEIIERYSKDNPEANFIEIGLLKDIISGKITNGSALKMRYQLLNLTPTKHFLECLLESYDYSAFEVLRSSFERGYLLDELRSDMNLVRLIVCQIKSPRYFPGNSNSNHLHPTNAGKLFENLMKIIAEKRPGILVNFLLKNKQLFKNNIGKNYNESLDAFEIFMWSFSHKLAEKNPSFKNKWYCLVKQCIIECMNYRNTLH